MRFPFHLFLNEVLVDRLWTLATKEPTTVEKAREAAGKLATKGDLVWKTMELDSSGC